MTTRIHSLNTGTGILREAVRRGRPGRLRRAAVMFDREWTSPLPMHAWLIEHDEGPILVDAGAVATARDLPFARFDVSREDEIDVALARVGVAPADLRSIVITHTHADHLDGLARLPADRVWVGEDELRAMRGPVATIGRLLLGTPLPAGFDPKPLRFGPDPFGAFARSAPLTADGSVVAVPTPGHTPGHISVIVVVGDRHYFLAGDASYDQAQLLHLHVDGLSPSAGQARETMRTILRHAAGQPTVYLPTHDVASRDRLIAGAPLPAAA
jgi:glyoxylase-like metal-dependent hydrolase (beta-lactamase superfamily II)